MQLILTSVVILVIVFVFMFDGDINKIKSGKGKGKSSSTKKQSNKTVPQSVKGKVSQDHLPFNSIKSSGGPGSPALIVKDADTYVGGIEVYGVNYNLLSASEKLVLEEVFQKTLNGLDYPIQIYVQSRRINLDSYNIIYNNRIDELIENLKKEQNRFTRLTERQAELSELEEVKDNVERIGRQIEYGESVIKFINSFASNDAILDKKYFIVTPYYYDASQFDQKQTDEEKYQTALNTILNRLESIMISLNGANMEGKILDGVELAELLYTSYNKPDADKYKLNNAVKSGFANHFVTSRPVEYKFMEHKKKKIEKEYKKRIEDIENGIYSDFDIDIDESVMEKTKVI